jgi:hypothetical protein
MTTQGCCDDPMRVQRAIAQPDDAESGAKALAGLLDRLEKRYLHTGVPACPFCGLGGSDHEVMHLIGMVRKSLDGVSVPAATLPAVGWVAEHEASRLLAARHPAVSVVCASDSGGSGYNTGHEGAAE